MGFREYLKKARVLANEKLNKQLQKLTKLLEKSLEKSVEVKKLEEEKQGINIKSFNMMKMLFISIAIITSFFGVLVLSSYLEILIKFLMISIGSFYEPFIVLMLTISAILAANSPLFLSLFFILFFIMSYSSSTKKAKESLGQSLSIGLFLIIFLMFLYYFSPFFIPYLDQKISEMKEKIQSENVKNMIDIFSGKNWEEVISGVYG